MLYGLNYFEKKEIFKNSFIKLQNRVPTSSAVNIHKLFE